MITKLLKIANTLDAKGEYDLANKIDNLIKMAADREVTYYLIEDDTWRIAPQTGISLTKEDGLKQWEYRDGMYSLVERIQSPMERSEKIIKPGSYLEPSELIAGAEDPPAWYEGED